MVVDLKPHLSRKIIEVTAMSKVMDEGENRGGGDSQDKVFIPKRIHSVSDDAG
jgi:hypothetical protein